MKRWILWTAVVFGFLAIGVGFAGCGAMAGMAPASQESITNNQEAGVDEGGIVKAVGETLIVLRRGRLFTVRIGQQELRPVCMVDAFPEGSELGSWYDEMLVHGRTVAVIGYSYRVSATEIGLFDLDDRGCIRHRTTWFMRSNDYYSSRNYASRLVDGKLVFYMPHVLGRYRYEDGRLFASADPPAMRRYDQDDWRQVLGRDRIHVPEEPSSTPTLHTVVSCDLTAPEMTCRACGMVGSFGRTFYVSPKNVYVWVHGGRSSVESDRPNATIYRLPLDGSTPSAVRGWGVPNDQFSFKEDADGFLNVLVRDAGGGDWMGGPERTSGSVSMARIPQDAFAARGRPGVPLLSRSMYTPLPRPTGDGYAFQNRFVGDYLLYGSGTSWGWARPGAQAGLYVHPYRSPGRTSRLSLEHGVDRIEAMGRDAVVIGSDGYSLHFSSLALAEGPRLVDAFIRKGASQGETRSHGFFYKPRGEREGMLGLPVRRTGPGYSHLFRGSAEILYLDVQELRFARLGALVAGDDRVDDQCVASCVDWYGNARPIFYRGRVFALLGYELVEGVVREGRITEVGRTHLFRDLSQ